MKKKKGEKKCQQWQVSSQEDHECGSLMCAREEKVELENMRAAKWLGGRKINKARQEEEEEEEL